MTMFMCVALVVLKLLLTITASSNYESCLSEVMNITEDRSPLCSDPSLSNGLVCDIEDQQDLDAFLCKQFAMCGTNVNQVS